MSCYLLDLRRGGALLRPLAFVAAFAVAFVLALPRVSLFAGASSTASTAVRDLPVVILDPGHGGEDPGCVGVGGILEKEVCLDYAKELGVLVSAEGYIPVFTRTEDKLVLHEGEDVAGIRKVSDLKNRASLAASYPDAVFVSVHMNSYPDAKVSGFTVYHAADAESEKLARCVYDAIVKDVEPDNRRALGGAKDIYVLENAACPAILIEVGFLTNPEDCVKIQKKEYRERLCFAVVCGMMEYEKSKGVGT